MKTATPKTFPIRWCTGGCSAGDHHAHIYTVDPVDGPLPHPYLCPGNLSEAKEWIDKDGEETGQGFIETAILPAATPYTARARKDAKRLISDIRAGRLTIQHGFRVRTKESTGLSYTSCAFPTLEAAFSHILTRAAHTGRDTARFTAIASRYFRRFGFPRAAGPTPDQIAQFRAEEAEEMDSPYFDHYAAI
jgi:hypothetical protein